MFDILTIFCGLNNPFCYGINGGRTPIRRIKLKNNDMIPKRLIPIILLVSAIITSAVSTSAVSSSLTTIQAQGINPYPNIGAIPLPAGYSRIPAEKNSFAAWLRTLPLKKNRTVYLYNGSPKGNQEAQFAVLDVSVNDPGIQPGAATLPPAPGICQPHQMPQAPKDLQQCADAVMRLRAEFLYSLGDFAHIDFYTGQGTRLNFAEWLQGRRYSISGGRLIAFSAAATRLSATPNCLRKIFGEYLQTVFTYCGTLSLEKQLDPLSSLNHMEIGDILIHGGSPGHAMLVIDMASNQAGQKIYMLSQGYMPAQDIHIVRNLYNDALSPWYPSDGKTIYTPEYTFDPRQFRVWRRSNTISMR
jgi:hypothetical protein